MFMSVIVNIGMWFERFVIIVTSLFRDYLPSSWTIYYSPTIWEIGFYLEHLVCSLPVISCSQNIFLLLR